MRDQISKSSSRLPSPTRPRCNFSDGQTAVSDFDAIVQGSDVSIWFPFAYTGKQMLLAKRQKNALLYL
jgi:hypothetical protein